MTLEKKRILIAKGIGQRFEIVSGRRFDVRAVKISDGFRVRRQLTACQLFAKQKLNRIRHWRHFTAGEACITGAFAAIDELGIKISGNA